jgi:hypothetical protein
MSNSASVIYSFSFDINFGAYIKDFFSDSLVFLDFSVLSQKDNQSFCTCDIYTGLRLYENRDSLFQHIANRVNHLQGSLLQLIFSPKLQTLLASFSTGIITPLAGNIIPNVTTTFFTKVS